MPTGYFKLSCDGIILSTGMPVIKKNMIGHKILGFNYSSITHWSSPIINDQSTDSLSLITHDIPILDYPWLPVPMDYPWCHILSSISCLDWFMEDITWLCTRAFFAVDYWWVSQVLAPRMSQKRDIEWNLNFCHEFIETLLYGCDSKRAPIGSSAVRNPPVNVLSISHALTGIQKFSSPSDKYIAWQSHR